MPDKNFFDSILNLISGPISLPPEYSGLNDRKKKIFAASVYHGLSEFTIGTGTPVNKEEHRTSTLMAYIATCLSWYNLFSALDECCNEQISILWNAQNKSEKQASKEKDGEPPLPQNAENLTGGDFGIAVNTSNGRYNLIFFQAKRALDEGEKEHFSINQTPSNYWVTGESFSPTGTAANNNLKKWVEKDFLLATRSDKEHQVFKLANQENYPFSSDFRKKHNESDVEFKEWAHYVIWRYFPTKGEEIVHNEGDAKYSIIEPLNISLSEVKTNLKTTWDAVKKTESLQELTVDRLFSSGGVKLGDKIFLNNINSTFASLLISGLDEDAKGWLNVSLEEAKTIVGHFSELGVHWSFVESSGSSPNLAQSFEVVGSDSLLNDVTKKLAETVAKKAQDAISRQRKGHNLQ